MTYFSICEDEKCDVQIFFLKNTVTKREIFAQNCPIHPASAALFLFEVSSIDISLCVQLHVGYFKKPLPLRFISVRHGIKLSAWRTLANTAGMRERCRI